MGMYWFNLLSLVKFTPLKFQFKSYFKVSMFTGTRVGGIDVLQWTETKVPSMRITGVDASKQHYVTISAINMAGLYTSQTYHVNYVPPE